MIIVSRDAASGLATITTIDPITGEKTVEVEYPDGTSYAVTLDPDSTVSATDVAQQAVAMKALEHKSSPEIDTEALKTEAETSQEVLDAIAAAQNAPSHVDADGNQCEEGSSGCFSNPDANVDAIKAAAIEEYVKDKTEEIQTQSVNSDGISVSDIKNLDGNGPIADISELVQGGSMPSGTMTKANGDIVSVS